MRDKQAGPLALALAGIAFLAWRAWKPSARPTVVFQQKHPTHKLVCKCQCVKYLGADTENPERVAYEVTISVPREGCESLSGVECNEYGGKLEGCKKVVVPTSLVTRPEIIRPEDVAESVE
jgi:hypothetical protein